MGFMCSSQGTITVAGVVMDNNGQFTSDTTITFTATNNVTIAGLTLEIECPNAITMNSAHGSFVISSARNAHLLATNDLTMATESLPSTTGNSGVCLRARVAIALCFR